MVDATSIYSAFSALQQAGQIVKAILEIRDAALIRDKVIELASTIIQAQGQTLSVQSQLSAAIDAERDLKQRLVEMEQWNVEKSRYELKEVAPGRFAYAIREAHSGMEPAHSICANCYQAGIKSILQFENLSAGRAAGLLCHKCKAQIVTRGHSR